VDSVRSSVGGLGIAAELTVTDKVIEVCYGFWSVRRNWHLSGRNLGSASNSVRGLTLFHWKSDRALAVLFHRFVFLSAFCALL
jgi:hypothetical protein